nr:hypothetical protein B0A51_12511 [Rachicladosporium sp. CCFEE 5018]
MADPLTAIGSAAAILQLTEEAAKLGIYLCKLYKDTKHVDKTVDQLGVEVVTLGETWTVVHVQLHAVIQTTAGTKRASIGVYDSTGQLWKCICDQVQHCWRTLKDLQGIIDAIGGTHGNIVTQIKRQIKVEGSKEAISSVRQRVGLHMSSIQMILQLISIEVAHLAPRHANHELLAKLNTLGKMVQDLNGQNTTVSGETAAVQIDGAASLIACVKEVMHSGASLYNASVADGSTYGGSHRAERQQWTTAWLQDLDALKTPDFAAASVNGSATPSNFSSGRIDLLQSGEVSLISDPLYNTEVQDIMDDDDHYIEHAMLTLGLEEGRRAVHCEQWAVADQHLKESLSLLLQLPENSRSTYDIIELQYMLAFCAFHFKEEDLKITREALTSLVDHP